MKVYPDCKINIGLQVLGRRADGYHNLQTVFYRTASMRDELEVLPLPDSSQPVMIQEGISLDNAPSDNICLQAWLELRSRYAIPPVSIRLRKGIPFGAGLGGGSSDAAHTLLMLNQIFNLHLSSVELHDIASRLGADVPFFLQQSTCFATGTGTELHPISIDLSDYDIRIELPVGEHISTREAYAGLQIIENRHLPDLREALARPVESWRGTVVNDFELSVFKNHPTIAALKEKMYAEGALYASMTGSGAAVYGIFKKNIS